MDITWHHALWVQENMLVQWVHDNPTFAYTIGLWRHHLPELIVMGMGMDHAGMTLNLIAARMYAHGAFKAGDLDTDLFTAPTLFKPVSRDNIRRYMTRMLEAAFQGGEPPLADLFEWDVLQVIWPDKRGIFPGEPGYSSEFIGRQPILA